MSLQSFFYAILFLIRLRLRGFLHFHDLVRRRYGGEQLLRCRKLERLSKKLEKAKRDLEFLQYCSLNNICPNFVKFKLYKSTLYRSQFYADATKKLLSLEIACKEKLIILHNASISQLKPTIFSTMSLIDVIVFKYLFNKNISEFVSLLKERHERKLRNLGIFTPTFSREGKTVFNFSHYMLSKREEFLLSLGLDFGLPNFKPNYCKFFLPLESLFVRLKNLKLCSNLSKLQNQLAELSHTTFRKLKTHWAPFFTKEDFELLKQLSMNEDIIITRPDKGKGTVILDKEDYIQKISIILDDNTKFENLGSPIASIIFRTEDKINNFLRLLKKEKVINESIYEDLFCSGSSFGILYGLPKIHKTNVPMRPILSSYSVPNYKLAKFLVPLLEPLTKNRYTVTNSQGFKEKIVCQDSDLFMVSLDVESLFTNIPVEETINLILDKIFTEPDTIYHNFNRSRFKQVLELAVQDTAFVFNNNAFKQVEGMAMGSPLGPTFANIFMCGLEESMLDNCPLRYHPLYYNRYVDDTFALFKTEYDAECFLDHANARHPNIKFTIEKEQSSQLSFLDVLVFRDNGHFNTSIFRKNTFTGLGSNFYSFCFYNFKINSLSTLLHRAFVLTSDWKLFHKEIEFLSNYFKQNCYPSKVFYNAVKTFLNKKMTQKDKPITVPKLDLYHSVPFLVNNKEFYRKLYEIIGSNFPAVKLRLIPRNPLTIGSMFRYKDRLNPLLTSNVVYKYSCPKCDFGTYVGSTKRLLRVRINSHSGVSYRTGDRLKNPEFSSIRNHARICNCIIKNEDFSIVGQVSNHHDLPILESLIIKQLVPSLNAQTSATQLYLA